MCEREKESEIERESRRGRKSKTLFGNLHRCLPKINEQMALYGLLIVGLDSVATD